MTLDLSSLQKAISQLEEALELCQSDITRSDPRFVQHLRAGAIQAFEFTYELAYKTLKRFLESTGENPTGIEEMTFNEIIRYGYEKGVLKKELSEWKGFRKNRGTTSHTYDEGKAQEVFFHIPVFLEEAKYLLAQIDARQKVMS